ASAGQGRLVNLVNLFGGRWLAMGLGAVDLAGLSSGLLGLAGGLAPGEGGGLALAGAGRLVELAAEALVLGLQGLEASRKGLAAATGEGWHTAIIGEAQATAALPRPQRGDQLELDALNKYQTITLGSELQINKNLTIQSPGDDQLTIDAGYSSRVFEVAGAG